MWQPPQSHANQEGLVPKGRAGHLTAAQLETQRVGRGRIWEITKQAAVYKVAQSWT